MPRCRCRRNWVARVSLSRGKPSLWQRCLRAMRRISDISPPKTRQVISTFESVIIGTGEGMVGSARERHNAQRQRMFHWSILVLRLSLVSWSLAVWESLIRSIGDSIGRFWILDFRLLKIAFLGEGFALG